MFSAEHKTQHAYTLFITRLYLPIAMLITPKCKKKLIILKQKGGHLEKLILFLHVPCI